jgi:cell division protease FtsH
VIGPVTVITEEGQMPLPGASDISPVTQQLVDEEVRHLIARAHEQVTQLMSSHRGQLDALAEALLAHETLDQDDAYAVAGLPPPEQSARINVVSEASSTSHPSAP